MSKFFYFWNQNIITVGYEIIAFLVLQVYMDKFI